MRSNVIPLALSVTVLLFAVGCSRTQSDAEKQFYSEKLSCPPLAIEEFQRWGESGTEHSCKIKDGPFVAWESGHVQIRGQYLNGKESGIWYWYDGAGKIEKKIDYSVPQPN